MLYSSVVCHYISCTEQHNSIGCRAFAKCAILRKNAFENFSNFQVKFESSVMLRLNETFNKNIIYLVFGRDNDNGRTMLVETVEKRKDKKTTEIRGDDHFSCTPKSYRISRAFVSLFQFYTFVQTAIEHLTFWFWFQCFVDLRFLPLSSVMLFNLILFLTPFDSRQIFYISLGFHCSFYEEIGELNCRDSVAIERDQRENR